MSNNLPAHISYSEIEKMSLAMSKSGLFGVKTPEQALSLMLVAQAENVHPAKAMMEYHIIEGRPALKSDAILARFQAAGGTVKWTCMTDQKVEAIFSHAAGGSVTIDWTMDRAKTAGLGGKAMWQKYGRQMLRARVISEGIRTVFPGIIAGTYSVEEAQDMDQPIHTEPMIVNQAPITVEAQTVAQHTTGNIQAALAGKKHTPVKSQPVIEVQPEVKAKPVSAGRDALAASIATDLAELSELTQDPAEMILESLTKGTIKTSAALSTAMFSHLSKLDGLVKAALLEARVNHQDSFDPFENDLVPENPFETN